MIFLSFWKKEFDAPSATPWICQFPANTRRLTNVGLVLDYRLRRWHSIKPTLVQGLVFQG